MFDGRRMDCIVVGSLCMAYLVPCIAYLVHCTLVYLLQPVCNATSSQQQYLLPCIAYLLPLAACVADIRFGTHTVCCVWGTFMTQIQGGSVWGGVTTWAGVMTDTQTGSAWGAVMQSCRQG